MQLAFMEGGSETVEMQANSHEARFGLFYGFTLLTTPLIGTVPKCLLAFEPEENMRVTFENATLSDPVTQTLSWDISPLGANGGLPPFPVVFAHPTTAKPVVVAATVN